MKAHPVPYTSPGRRAVWQAFEQGLDIWSVVAPGHWRDNPEARPPAWVVTGAKNPEPMFGCLSAS